jgi:hypothetical protein
MLRGMQYISAHSSLWRNSHRGLVAGFTVASTYVIGGGLLLTQLLGQGGGSIQQDVRESAPARMSVEAPAAPPADRSARQMPLLVSVVDGPTYICLVPADTVSADALVATNAEFLRMSRVRECQ